MPAYLGATPSDTAMPTLSKDGQIRIPADIRRRHGWAAGQTLDVVETDAGVTLRLAEASEPKPIDREAVRVALERLREGVTPVFPPTTRADVRAVLAYSGPRLSLDQLGIEGLDPADDSEA